MTGRPLEKTRNLWITYTIMFCLLMIGIFLLFILQHRTFVNLSDAYDQGYFWTTEMKQNLQALFAGDGYPMWSWARGTGMDLKPPIDPFLMIAALFPIGYIELGYTVAIVLRMYCAGLAFLAFGGEVGMAGYNRLMGAICYVFASWSINVALIQGQFIDILILFPLLVMGVDKIYKGKTPALFIAVVGFSVAINYYLAFMSAIAIVIYILLRYFHYMDRFSLPEYLSYIIRFVVFGLIGIMTAAFFVLVTIKTLMGATTGSGSEAVAFFSDMDDLMKYPLKLLSQGYSFTYGYIGLPILALLILPIGLRKLSIRNTYVIMAIILFVFSLMPVMSSVMNGFSYVTTRWYFTYIFFLVWTSMECLDFEQLKKWSNLAIMGAWWAVLLICIPGFAYMDKIGHFDGRGGALFVCGNLAAGLVLLIVFALGRSRIMPERAGKVAVAVISVAVLVGGWNCAIRSDTDNFCKVGQINNELEASTQRAGAMIEDDGFYRIDQVDGINIHHNAGQPANENIWWGTNTLYSYDSKTPASLLEFNKLVGNNYGYSKRVYVLSNGNRMGLDYLYGVKYFLGDDTKNGTEGSDGYAGYGFSYKEQLDGVNIFENKYDPELGFVYDKFISRSEFLKLSRLQREQSLLQAIVLEDETCGNRTYGQEVTAEDIETDIKTIPYEIIETDGVTFDGNSFYAEKEEASFKLYVSGVVDSQLIVSFDNLQRLDEDGDPKGNFYISCSNGTKSAAANNYENNQTIEGIVDFDLNMGAYEYYSGALKIHLPKSGQYTFDRMYVSAMSTENYDHYAAEREKGRYKVSKYTSDTVKGKVNAAREGYLFISMPNHSNWDVYIDGKEAQKVEPANIAFFAVHIDKGKHEVVLKYDYTARWIGLIISLAGIVLALGICLIMRWRRKRSR